MNIYNLIRIWYNFKFENPNTTKHIHSDLYCYILDLWNRLGQKEHFGLPTSITMESLGIGSYNTYKKALQDLIDFGFVILISESKNQHYSKVVALSINDKATDKALDKATIKATDEATDKATDTINRQIYNYTNIQYIEGEEEKNKDDVSSVKKNEKEERKKVAQKKEINIPVDFIPIWEEWLSYRKAKKKKPYAGVKWEQIAFDKFYSISNADALIANEILQQTITRNWDGLFELKKINNGNTEARNSNTGKSQFIFDREKAVDALLRTYKDNIPKS